MSKKQTVKLVLRSQAMISGELRKAEYLMLEGIPPKNVTADQVEKQLQTGNLKAIIIEHQDEPQNKAEPGSGEAGKSGSGAK